MDCSIAAFDQRFNTFGDCTEKRMRIAEMDPSMQFELDSYSMLTGIELCMKSFV